MQELREIRERQKCRDRTRCTFVSIWCPSVKWNCRYFEREPNNHKHNAECMQRTETAVDCDALAQVDKQSAVGCTVQQRHAVQHDRRCKHAEQEILDACFVALDVALAPCGKHVCRDREKLECNKNGNEVASRRHHHHAKNAREQQEVILATPILAFFNMTRRKKDYHIASDQEHCFHHDAEIVDYITTIKH